MALGTQIASLFAKIGADTSELNKGLNAADARLGQTAKKMDAMGTASGDAEGSTKNFGATLTQFATTVGVVAGAVGGMAIIAKKAFDFSEEGAAVIQTATSFDRLGVSIEAMRAASRGTIDDVGLMSSTLTLVAGASEELQAKMLESAPQLMEIAKAANAVNPALGDTAFMYDSLARGIKRSSPLILDNLGVIVKIGEANETYAAAIGKTVEQLTAEDRQIAILNATMEAGNRLIEQAGGSTAAYGDAWAVVTAEAKNATDAMKAQAAEGLAPLITRYAVFLQRMREGGDGLIGFAAGFRFLNEVILDVQDTVGEFSYGELVAIEHGMEAIGQGFSDVGASAPSAAVAVYDSATAFEQYNAAIAANDAANLATMISQMWETSEAAGAAAIANMNFAASIGELSTAQFAQASIELMAEAMREAGLGAEEVAAGTRAILVEFGLLTPAEEKAAEVMADLAGKMVTDAEKADIYAAALLNISNYMASLESKEIDLTINTRFNTYGDPAAAGGAGGYVDPGTGSGFGIDAAQGFQGMVSSPASFNVAEGGEPEFVSVVPRSQMMSGGYGMGSSWSGNLIVQGTGDPESTASAVLRKLADRGMIPASGALR